MQELQGITAEELQKRYEKSDGDLTIAALFFVPSGVFTIVATCGWFSNTEAWQQEHTGVAVSTMLMAMVTFLAGTVLVGAVIRYYLYKLVLPNLVQTSGETAPEKPQAPAKPVVLKMFK